MKDCIFCKIVNGEIPADIVYKSSNIIGFRDLNPIAPTHILFIPKKHYATLSDVPSEEMEFCNDIMNAITETAEREGVVKSGYRVVINTNRNAGQEIFHLHVHLIGGERLGKMG